MNAMQAALARGLDLLTSERANGDIFRVHGASGTFSASLSSEVKETPGVGPYLRTAMCVRRSAFASLPVEGAVIEREDGSESFAVVGYEPSVAGYINIIVRSAQL